MSLTKIQAVNIMLDAIDEEPVSSLDSGLPDAETAERFLDRVTKDVLTKGWNCNTEYDWKLTRDANTEYRVPNKAMRIDTTGVDKDIKVSVRDDSGVRKLYDIKNQTFTWTNKPTLYVEITWEYDFADLPHELQSFIAYHAARKFQKSEMGSVALDTFTAEDEASAWAALMDYEADQEDANELTDNSHGYYISQRTGQRTF